MKLTCINGMVDNVVWCEYVIPISLYTSVVIYQISRLGGFLL